MRSIGLVRGTLCGDAIVESALSNLNTAELVRDVVGPRGFHPNILNCRLTMPVAPSLPDRVCAVTRPGFRINSHLDDRAFVGFHHGQLQVVPEVLITGRRDATETR